MEQVRVGLQAPDPVSLAGLVSYLGAQPEFAVVNNQQRHEADVMVVVTATLNSELVAGLRRAATSVGKPVVLIIDEMTAADLHTAMACRVVAVLPRAGATGDQVGKHVLAAHRGGVGASNLVDELLSQIEQLQRGRAGTAGAGPGGLTAREVDVLRLMAEGLDTAAVAINLSYSERTVKKVVQGVTERLELRNRTHAIAYAVRAGLI